MSQQWNRLFALILRDGLMIGATLLGLLFTPFFYVLLRTVRLRMPRPFR